MNPYLMTGPERVAYCGQLMESMTAMIQRPSSRVLNEEQTKQRLATRQHAAGVLRIIGLPLAPRYRTNGTN